jgi:hypothetical protein
LHITFYTKNQCSRSILIRIRIHWIHMILGIPERDLDPLVRGMDPDPDPTLNPDPALDPDPNPFIIKQK